MEQNKNKKICEVCKDEATCICYKCFLYFCDSCYKIAHNRQKDKESQKRKNRFFCTNRYKMSRAFESY